MVLAHGEAIVGLEALVVDRSVSSAIKADAPNAATALRFHSQQHRRGVGDLDVSRLRGIHKKSVMKTSENANQGTRCPACVGTGQRDINDPNCPRCHGSGFEEVLHSHEESVYGSTDGYTTYDPCSCRHRATCECCFGTGHDEVSRLAFILWEHRGRPLGSSQHDWFLAENEIKRLRLRFLEISSHSA